MEKYKSEEFSALRARISEQEKTISEMEKASEEKEKTIRELRKEVDDLNNSLRDVEDEKDNLEEEVRGLEDKVADLECETVASIFQEKSEILMDMGEHLTLQQLEDAYRPFQPENSTIFLTPEHAR